MLHADDHGLVFFDQVLQQLNVCSISKKRKVKAQFEGKQARLKGLPQATALESQRLQSCGAVGDDVVLPVTTVGNEHLKPTDRSHRHICQYGAGSPHSAAPESGNCCRRNSYAAQFKVGCRSHPIQRKGKRFVQATEENKEPVA